MTTTVDERVADDERDLLPMVRVLMAHKQEETRPVSILAAVLAVCNVWDSSHVNAIKKRTAKLETKVCTNIVR